MCIFFEKQGVFGKNIGFVLKNGNLFVSLCDFL